MELKKIMCACGSGLGSSLMVEMNIKDVLKDMGIKGVQVVHTTTSDVRPGAADLFIIGHDLANFVKGVPKEQIITLVNIVDKGELKTKLTNWIDSQQ